MFPLICICSLAENESFDSWLQAWNSVVYVQFHFFRIVSAAGKRQQGYHSPPMWYIYSLFRINNFDYFIFCKLALFFIYNLLFEFIDCLYICMPIFTPSNNRESLQYNKGKSLNYSWWHGKLCKHCLDSCFIWSRSLQLCTSLKLFPILDLQVN